jgi:chemotaxis response regulator CheB
MTRKNKRESTAGDRLRRRGQLPEATSGPPGSSIENLVVIGASAGGHKALKEVLRDLSEDIPAALIIMLHATQLSLKDLIQQATRVPVREIREGRQLRMGVVYVAPPGVSVTLRGKRLHIAPYDRGSGPATTINILFESAAENFSDRVIGVVLTGSLRDGTVGLKAVHDAGGLTIVQDPAEAEFPEMPISAMKDLPVTFCLRLSDIGLTLDLLARRKTMLETGLSVSVRTLKERVALLVRLVGQSERNPETYKFLSTEMATLKLYLRSIQKLLDQASADAKKRAAPRK